MKLLIFGATGGTGQELVKQALVQGHVVTAFVRTPAKLTLQHPKLRTAQGDILNAAAIEKVMEEQEVVLSALGGKTTKPNTTMSDGTKNIIDAMKKFGVKRFICETAWGVGDSRPYSGFFYGKIIIPLFLKNPYADKDVQERYIRESDLEWVIVRPTGLTNGARTGQYHVVTDYSSANIKGTISRADVAAFMLKQLSDNTYLRKTVGISY